MSMETGQLVIIVHCAITSLVHTGCNILLIVVFCRSHKFLFTWTLFVVNIISVIVTKSIWEKCPFLITAVFIGDSRIQYFFGKGVTGVAFVLWKLCGWSVWATSCGHWACCTIFSILLWCNERQIDQNVQRVWCIKCVVLYKCSFFYIRCTCICSYVYSYNVSSYRMFICIAPHLLHISSAVLSSPGWCKPINASPSPWLWTLVTQVAPVWWKCTQVPTQAE